MTSTIAEVRPRKNIKSRIVLRDSLGTLKRKFEIELAVVFVIPSSLVSYVFSNRHALNFFGEKRVQIIELLTILTSFKC